MQSIIRNKYLKWAAGIDVKYVCKVCKIVYVTGKPLNQLTAKYTVDERAVCKNIEFLYISRTYTMYCSLLNQMKGPPGYVEMLKL